MRGGIGGSLGDSQRKLDFPPFLFSTITKFSPYLIPPFAFSATTASESARERESERAENQKLVDISRSHLSPRCRSHSNFQVSNPIPHLGPQNGRFPPPLWRPLTLVDRHFGVQERKCLIARDPCAKDGILQGLSHELRAHGRSKPVTCKFF